MILPTRALLAEDIVSGALGTSYDATTPDGLTEALAAIHALPDAEVAAMSRRGHAGAGDLAQSHDAWADEMVGLYRRALAAA